MRMERETLKSEKGFCEIMKLWDGHFKKDRDSERLEKAIEYFTARWEKEETVSEVLVRHEKIRNYWKKNTMGSRRDGGVNSDTSSRNK